MAKYLWNGIRHAYIVYNNASALGYVRTYLTKASDFKPVSQELTFAGDGQSIKKKYGYEFTGTIEADADNTLLDSVLWATPVVSPSGGDDFTQRWVRGTRAELQTNYVEVRVTIDGEDADTGAVAVKRLRVLKCLFDPDVPVKMQSQAVFGRMLSFNTRFTTTDVLGNPVTGVPATGAVWVKDILLDPAKFDPVAGDLL